MSFRFSGVVVGNSVTELPYSIFLSDIFTHPGSIIVELFASGSIALFSASLKLVDARGIAMGPDNSGNKDISVALGTTRVGGCFGLTNAFNLLLLLFLLFLLFLFFKKGLLITYV